MLLTQVPGFAESGISLSSPFNSETPQTEINARIAAWNPEKYEGLIAVSYLFPEGHHQTDSEEFFTLKPQPVQGITFGSVLKSRPDTSAADSSGDMPEYHRSALLLLEFHVTPQALPDGPTAALPLTLEALFQLCGDDGACLFPENQAVQINFNPASKAFQPDAETLAVLQWNKNHSAAEQDSTAAGSASGSGNNLSGESPQSAGTALESIQGSGNSRASNNTTAGSSAPEGSSAENPASRPERTDGQPPKSPASTLLLFLLMAFAGGILLNIMPCVLPLLSVKALGLVKQAGESRREILRHSWLYVAGIEASFWALAAIVIVLQTSGRRLGWGFQFQSPSFVLILTAFIWMFALSMFDVFVIEAPRKSMEGAASAGARGGYLGSFLTGIFAVLVATPCTAPFLGAALGFAFSQPPLTILAIFSLTGLGLGLPFLLLGIWPKIIQKIPKPGAWMNTFKEVMGFLLLGTAVYLFTTFSKLAPAARNPAMWWLLILSFAAWLLGHARRPTSAPWFRITGQIAALIIAVGSGLLLIDLSDKETASVSAAEQISISSEGIRPFNEQEVEERIAEGKPVFLEFTAAWCTTCKVNQRVLKDPAVIQKMADKGVFLYKGDLTAYDETLTKWLSRFGRAGVPLYVLFAPGEEPYIFPELISVEALTRELEKLN